MNSEWARPWHFSSVSLMEKFFEQKSSQGMRHGWKSRIKRSIQTVDPFSFPHSRKLSPLESVWLPCSGTEMEFSWLDSWKVTRLSLQSLQSLQRVIQNMQRGLLTSGIVLHDNAWVHIATATKRLLHRFPWEVFDHPPYTRT